MKTLLMALAASAVLTASHAMAAPADIPAAVYTDPAPDAAYPPSSAQVLIPSGGVGMNALFYLAGGPGPHPTLLLLHGLPGNEQNLDLAQAVRRAGWNVLTLHYRGSWGSPGTFSIAHVLEDADAAAAFVRRPDIAAKYGIDTRRIVMGGHSMGGFATAAHASHDPYLAGVLLLDAWNAGESGAQLALLDPRARAAAANESFNDFGNSLAGATPDSVAEEIAAHAGAWNYLAWAPALSHRPLLVIGAAKALGAENHALAQAVIKAGGQAVDITLPSDHAFQDRRIEVEADVVRWLQALPTH
jgi:pimeloyl-ACP methyl ester carboxylesterase